MLQVDAFAWGWRSGKLTCFHCHGRTHVYALCRTFVVDKFVCFHWTKANSHRFRQIDRKACALAKRRHFCDSGPQRWMPIQIDVFVLATSFKLSRLLVGCL
jgi:hypothetical protein